MRPRRFRRGKLAPCNALAPRSRRASMRPRRFRRGKPARDGKGIRLSAAASMRPRRFRRGKLAQRGVRLRKRDGFNEAPAIPPGKTGWCEQARPCACRRFNEAPAIPPGKTRFVNGRITFFHPLQ